jgi:competence protein ComEC
MHEEVFPIKKIAAACALCVGAGYLALSGGAVATERAFVMVAVMFVAILLNRRAITLRAVAIAALIVLLLRPEALIGAGFQMSFAATVALVTVFGAMSTRPESRFPNWAKPVVAVVMSSFIAGIATAPFSALHFNQIAQYGLLANVISVPVMGAIIMPMAVIAALLVPFGLDFIAFEIMGWGISWILWVADWVAGMSGAVTRIPTPHRIVLPVFAIGALFTVLWRGRGFGVALACVALVIWARTERPDVLIADSGGLVGVMTPDGRALSRAKGDGFVAQVWLENDGDGTDQETAATRGFTGENHAKAFKIGNDRAIILRTKKGGAMFETACASYDVVVYAPSAKDQPDYPTGGRCRWINIETLRDTGTIAFYVNDGGISQINARDAAGRRLWNSTQ